MTQNHSPPINPTPGVYRITYINVANGRKMIPSSGTIPPRKAAPTSAGRAIQMMNSASRGNSPAKSANRQPIVRSLHRGGPRAANADRRNQLHSRANERRHRSSDLGPASASPLTDERDTTIAAVETDEL